MAGIVSLLVSGPMEPPDRPPPYAVRWIRCLLKCRDEAQSDTRLAEDELARAVYELRTREGVSVRTLARELGVGPSTVHGWTKRGELLASQDETQRR